MITGCDSFTYSNNYEVLLKTANEFFKMIPENVIIHQQIKGPLEWILRKDEMVKLWNIYINLMKDKRYVIAINKELLNYNEFMYNNFKDINTNNIEKLTQKKIKNKKKKHKNKKLNESFVDTTLTDKTIESKLCSSTESVIESPLNTEPVVEPPLNKEPSINHPLNEKPLNTEPLNEKPLNKEPSINHPLNEEPSTNHPLNKEPLINHPSIKQSLNTDSVIKPSLNAEPVIESPLFNTEQTINYQSAGKFVNNNLEYDEEEKYYENNDEGEIYYQEYYENNDEQCIENNNEDEKYFNDLLQKYNIIWPLIVPEPVNIRAGRSQYYYDLSILNIHINTAAIEINNLIRNIGHQNVFVTYLTTMLSELNYINSTVMHHMHYYV
jgi:hypothetical protein